MHETRWFWCGDWVSGWWVYSHLVDGVFCCSITHFFLGSQARPSLTQCPLEPGCEDYSFLDQAVTDFEQGLDSILTDFINIPELDTSFEEPNIIISSVSLGSYTQLVPFLILLNHSLLVASNVANYGASLEHYFCLCHLQARCQLLNWYDIFPAIQWHLVSSLLHHWITSLSIMLIKRLISVFLIYRLALVQLLLPFLIWSSSLLIPEVLLLIPLPFHRILMVEWYQLQKSMNYSLKNMIFWIMLYLSRLGKQLVF